MRPERILPHVTPSPRVPAADWRSGLHSLLSDIAFLTVAHPERAGLVERMSSILPHVTPSPRVPAAYARRRSGSPILLAHPEGNRLVERTVSILPHVTPSPRVPAANQPCGPVSPLICAHPKRVGLASWRTRILPHVTPSPRVPAATLSRRSYSHCTHTFSLFSRRACDPVEAHSASRHSFPKSTCSHSTAQARFTGLIS
jgi:hypothetical protein